MVAKVYLSERAAGIVKQLLETGLYGGTMSEVCQRIVEEKLRESVVVPKLRPRRAKAGE